MFDLVSWLSSVLLEVDVSVLGPGEFVVELLFVFSCEVEEVALFFLLM